MVDPDENDSVKYDTEDEMISCCAVILPPTIKSPDVIKDPVILAPLELTTKPFFTIN